MTGLTISVESVRSLLVRPRFGDTVLGTATGFVVTAAGSSYLVTNRHVVTGRHSDTNIVLHNAAALPDNLIVLQNSSEGLGKWVERMETLYTGPGVPRWREHPAYGPRVDVVALPLTQVSGVSLFPYDLTDSGPKVAVRPSDLVSIVGFPFGLLTGGALGIWMSGFVASEPQVPVNDLPMFLVDSRTRPGSSGSPVIAHRTGGGVVLEDGSTAFMGQVTRFLGVYSGRVNEDSDIGMVWKHALIAEIVAGDRTGTP